MSTQNLSVLDPAVIAGCVVCQRTSLSYAFEINKNNFFQCDNCRTIVPENYLSKAIENATKTYDVSLNPDVLKKMIIDTLKDRSAKGAHLIVSTFNEAFLVEKLMPDLPSSTVYLDLADFSKRNKEKFDIIVMLTPLSMVPNLNIVFLSLREALKQDGLFVFFQPMLDSSLAKVMANKWIEWKQAHSFYIVRDALHSLILNKGFDRLWFRKAVYSNSPDYLHLKLKCAHLGFLKYCFTAVSLLLRVFFNKIKSRPASSYIIASCQLTVPNIRPLLSIIIPVFNEENTFEDLIQRLLCKTVDGMRKQIIIVESNSTDGTRELVKKYSDHPDVQIIWQDQAKGKGFAVREGLAAANGDYVLIQDADLEYDINDYESLLAPLRASKAMFVLGSRHSGSWRIREFNNDFATATVFNIGHVFFTWFVNKLTSQNMSDPFTMFKVFRRDAIYGLHFVCKRFDFDHEMVIKLIRKGYQPLELPVNYRARSFAEGKKVSFVKDGLTWVWIDMKLRFGRLGKWLH